MYLTGHLEMWDGCVCVSTDEMRATVSMCSQTCIKDDDAVAAMETERRG